MLRNDTDQNPLTTMPEKINIVKMSSSSKCSCCPYGFHIDRDFVRFCDTLYNTTQLDKLRQQRRERRKEKKSVESYLGIGHIAPCLENKVANHVFNKTATLPHDFYLHSEGLKDAVIDFENTWQKSLRKSSSSSDIPKKQNGNLSFNPKIHISSNSNSSAEEKKEVLCNSDVSRSFSSSTSSVSSQSTTISNFNGLNTSDVSNSESLSMGENVYSAKQCMNSATLGSSVQRSVLTNIRQQMASSLLRLKELEEQVKCIPILEIKLSALKEEKKSLINQLKLSKYSLPTEKSSKNQHSLEIQLKKLVNQGIMSPTLGRKCLMSSPKDSDLLSSPTIASCLNATISKKCVNENKTFSHLKVTNQNQSENKNNKNFRSIGISCSVLTRDIGIGYVPNKLKSIAVGCDTLSKRIISTKRNKNYELYEPLSSESLESDLESFGGSDEQNKPSYLVNLISSKNSDCKDVSIKKCIDVATSMDKLFVDKSFNTNFLPAMSIGKDSQNHLSKCSKIVQTEFKTFRNIGSQTLLDRKVSKLYSCAKCDKAIGDGDIDKVVCNNCKTIKKCTAVGDFNINITDCEKCQTFPLCFKTIGVGDFDINHFCKECEQYKLNNLKTKTTMHSIGINTSNDLTHNSSDLHICDKCSATIYSVARGLAANSNDSKIPRSNMRTSPIGKTNKAKISKLKIPMCKSSKVEEKIENVLPASDINDEDKMGESNNSLHSENQNDFQYTSKTKAEDESECSENIPTGMNLSIIPRKKAAISKEIRAACKVLNDCLQKSEKGKEKKALSSLAIIQTEWFRVANQKNADPLLIEDYLDLFEDFSKMLLQRVVNLSDTNGNTALHYAVSYGNFDVVSILIDSKVCDVNKKNKAGYTSIMLVALAHMKNDIHQYVVQRLFSIGDINMKATQNGQTALMLAVSHGKKEIAKILLDAGAEVNLQDKDGSTALMCAAEHGQLEIVKLLISHPECDPCVVDNDDCTALAIAMEAGHKDIGLLIYTSMNFSRGSSPYSTLKSRKRSTPRSTPPPRTPTLRTPPLPSPSARSTNSIPSSFHFSA